MMHWVCNTVILKQLHYHGMSGIALNSLRPRQNGRHISDDIFKCIFLTENVWIPIIISLKFVPKGPISNIPALVQIMAWRRPGDKPLSEPMMVRFLTHICVTRPQWVKWFRSYLTHRSQYVELNYTASHQKLIETGVPQGSIPGPLLVLIYMNDIPNVSNVFKFISFADDTGLFSTIFKHIYQTYVKYWTNRLSKYVGILNKLKHYLPMCTIRLVFGTSLSYVMTIQCSHARKRVMEDNYI